MLLRQCNVGTADLYNVFRFPIMYFRDFSVVAQIFPFKNQHLGAEDESSLKALAEAREVCIAWTFIGDGAHSTMSVKPGT